MIPVLRLRPEPPARGEGALVRFGPPSGYVATSGEAVRWLARLPRSVVDRSRPLWAAGTVSARWARALGWADVRTAPVAGAQGIARALARSIPGRWVRIRSDRAGPGLARALRAAGHRVLDLVAYRVDERRSLTRLDRAAIERAALRLVTSPSAAGAFLRLCGRAGLRSLRARPFAAVGAETVRALRSAGMRGVVRIPAPGAQRFTPLLLRRIREAGGR